MKTARLMKGLLYASLVLCTASALHAQRGPGGGGGGPHPGGGMPGGGGPGFPGGPGGGPGGFPSGGRNNDPGRPSARNTPNNGSTRNGLQLGPPGRWWDDKGFAKTVGLRKEQQKKMDLIFNTNKSAIVESYKTLQREESKLDAITKESQVDKGRLFAQIDAVNQARAGLEKVNAQMLLQIRQEMEPEQISRMDRFREKPQDESEN